MKTRNELINEVKSLDLTQFITELKDLSTLQAPSVGNTFKPFKPTDI